MEITTGTRPCPTKNHTKKTSYTREFLLQCFFVGFSLKFRYVGWLTPAKNATEILLDSVDYFTVLLTGISGIFVNSLPLSFSTALAHSAKPPNAKIPGLFRYFLARTSGIFVNNPPPKTLRSSLVVIAKFWCSANFFVVPFTELTTKITITNKSIIEQKIA